MFIDSSTYRLLLDNRKLFTADQARGKTFNNKQQHSISRKALPRIHEEEKKEKAKKNKRIVNQTNQFLLLFHHSPLLSEEEKEEVFLASTRTFCDKNLCQSSRKFSVGYCGHSRKIFFRFYSSKTDPIKAEKAQLKAKRKKRSFHQIK